MITISAYHPSQKQQVIDLILHIQNQEAGIGLSLSEQPDLDQIEAYYFESGGYFWTATHHQDVIGTIALHNLGNGCGVLKKFFVSQAFRSQKVGFHLYQELLKFTAANGFHTLILDTPSVAHAAHRFYERNGFVRIEKEELPVPYSYPDRDCYLYQCLLNG